MNEERHCVPSRPMPDEAQTFDPHDKDIWVHHGATRDAGASTDLYEVYRCPNCHLVFLDFTRE